MNDTAPDKASMPAPLELTWRHPHGMLGLSVTNFVLKILTLGIYGFWGKTEVRKRLWSAVRINGEPLHYTGTGKELLVGFLIVFFVVFVPTLAASAATAVAFGSKSPAFEFVKLAIYLFFFALTGIAIYRAQRYRLSRTQWRGIRGGLDGSSAAYAWRYIWTALLIPLTLGWITPWRATKLQAHITRDMRFGNHPFTFSAQSRSLYPRFAVFWLLAVAIVIGLAILFNALLGPYVQYKADHPAETVLPQALEIAVITGGGILGLIVYLTISAWYHAKQIKTFASGTHYAGASFKSTVTARGLLWMQLSNLLLIVSTLGLLTPIAQARAARYTFENLSIDGHVDLADILQNANTTATRGEGLAQIFDIDAF